MDLWDVSERLAMNKRQRKIVKRKRKQQRKFKQQGRRLVRRAEGKKREQERVDKMPLQEQLKLRAQRLARQMGWDEFCWDESEL